MFVKLTLLVSIKLPYFYPLTIISVNIVTDILYSCMAIYKEQNQNVNEVL